MYNSEALDKIRKRIDELDNHVHDLFLERADLVMQISEEKKKHNIQIVQPAREARMIRRLLSRHRGPLPEETIVRIWRELVGSISLLQTGLSVTVYQSSADQNASYHYWDMARDYFGSVLPIKRNISFKDMLNDVNEDRVNFAVLPLPSHGNQNPWWVYLKDYPALKITQRLPYGQKENFVFEDYPALVVAKSGFDTSDDDHAMIVVNSEGDISRGRIVEAFEKMSLKPISVWSHDGQTLVEVADYISANDDRLDILKSYINVDDVVVQLVGGFPTPLTYKK